MRIDLAAGGRRDRQIRHKLGDDHAYPRYLQTE
jgi:hypothetical protein